ncbi:hypothetical protein COO60DRAFT_388996 [Scenedesmus sp. NREL 46B-D3]|nr:hypothetical protein COO60DRAFT_388996 [Scenedesmus sp. NREL 46B-D3]
MYRDAYFKHKSADTCQYMPAAHTHTQPPPAVIQPANKAPCTAEEYFAALLLGAVCGCNEGRTALGLPVAALGTGGRASATCQQYRLSPSFIWQVWSCSGCHQVFNDSQAVTKHVSSCITTKANRALCDGGNAAPPEQDEPFPSLGLTPDMFGCWQQAHAAALVECWSLPRMWELPPTSYDVFYALHGANAHATVMNVECEYPSVFAQADVARALHLLHCSYRTANYGRPKGRRACPGWGFFKHGLSANPLKAGEGFPAALAGTGSCDVPSGAAAAAMPSLMNVRAAHVVQQTACGSRFQLAAKPHCTAPIAAAATLCPAVAASGASWQGHGQAAAAAAAASVARPNGSSVPGSYGVLCPPHAPRVAALAVQSTVSPLPQVLFVRVHLHYHGSVLVFWCSDACSSLQVIAYGALLATLQ